MSAVDLLERLDLKFELRHLFLNLRLVVAFLLLLEELVDLVYIVFGGSLQDSESTVLVAQLLLLIIGETLLLFQLVYLFVHLDLCLSLQWIEKLFLSSVLFQIAHVVRHSSRHPYAFIHYEPQNN